MASEGEASIVGALSVCQSALKSGHTSAGALPPLPLPRYPYFQRYQQLGPLIGLEPAPSPGDLYLKGPLPPGKPTILNVNSLGNCHPLPRPAA